VTQRFRNCRLGGTPWTRRAAADGTVAGDDASEAGFSLLELIIVTAVLPIVIGAITLALISIFSLQGGAANRLTDSGDAQAISANLEKDVQGAALVTTNGTSTGLAPCDSSSQAGAGQLLGLESQSAQVEISYVEVAQGTTNSLFRNVCQNGSSTPTSSQAIALDIPSGQTATVTCTTVGQSGCNGTTNVTNSWIPASDVANVMLSVTAPGSKFSYTLVAVPGASSSSSASSTVTASNSGCGFATPGTGTYASTLCFVDFSAFNGSSTCPGASGYQLMSAPIANTPYTMTFCVKATGSAVSPHSIPTYFAPPTSEAFLGNNGFYTGIPGNPAIYQTTGGTTTVTIIDIQVLDSSGSPATGWELVTGDAESTDSNESMTWTIPQTGGPVLNLLDNSPISPYGNACAFTGDPGGVDLTGLGTQTVTCGASVSSDKTGTVMLEAQTPNSLTVTMLGGGLEAMFLGLLLP
jgi:prepilin-type N-terminal cleavage/methylation domain-containing protein